MASANNTKFNVKDALEDLGAPPLIAPSSSNNNVDSGGPAPPTLVTSKVVATLSTIASLNNTKVVPLEVMKRMVHMMLDETITSKLIHSSLLVAIGHLATFERSRMLLGDSTECIAALCSQRFLEQFNSPNIQSGTLEALWQLVQSYRKNQEKLAKQNNLVALIAIIQREAEKNRNKASQLLDLLVTQESCAHSLVQSESFMEATSICVEVKHTEQWAAQFYHHLSEHKECCRAIVEFATVDALVELLKRGLFYDNVAYRKMCIHVLRTLHNVTLLDNRCRASLTSAIPCLIQYIRTRSHLLTMGKVSEATEKNVQNCEGRELCCKILANITEELPEEKLVYSSHNRANRDKLRRNKLKVVNCNGLPVLCHLMKGLAEQTSGVDPSQLSPEFIAHSAAVQKLAIKIVANVASIEENVLKMLGLEVYNDERDDFLDADELRDNMDEMDRNDDVYEDGLEDIQPPEELLEDIARENAKNEEQELQEQQEQQQQSQPPPPATPATKPTTPATPATPAKPTPPAPATPSKSTAPPAPATPTAPTTAAPAPPSEAEATSETTDDAAPEIKQVDAQTLEQLREQMKDGLFLTNLLLDLLIGCKDADKRQHVISAISAFAIHPKCANQLVDLGVIARLLEMIQSKVESIVIASLFASMNVHDSFQKKLYSIGGLKPLINLLSQKATQAELEAGLIAVGPFVRTPNGRMILKKEGVLQRLKELLKQTDNSDQVILLAKEILRVLKTESDATMYALTGENTGDDMVNYDEIFRIARDFVQVTQSSIQKLMNRRHIRVHVNWRRLEKQKEIASEAMGLLSREALWDGIVFATEIFINSSPGNLLAFQNNVAMIILEVNDSEDSKDYCEVKIENLIMRYRIAQTGRLLTPKSLAAEISMEIYDEDVTGYNADEEEQDEAYQLAVESLKKVTSDSRIPLIGDLNALYFHLETAISLWKPNFQENQGFIAAKNAVMDHNELFLKGWKIVKFNKDGMRQERLLLLTDKCYYTVHFDYNIRKIDYKHSKQHNLEDYFLIDIGKLRDNKDDDPTLDWARPYALSLVTKEKAHSKSKVAEEADEDFETTTASEVDDDEDLLTSTDMMSSGHGSDDEMTASQAVIDVENAIMGGNEEEDERITRPSTKGKYSSVFVAPNSIAPNMQQSYIEEIALCIYAAAAAYRREEIFPPFRRAIKKPGSNSLKAKLYNTFFGSKTVDTTVPRGNSGNKLTTPASSETEQKQNMRDILAKRKNIK